MIQAGDRFRFSFETLLANWIRRQLWGQNLDRHRAVEPRVSRAIDFSHTARTQRRLNLV
jgi:hypothetical protein